MLFKQTLHKYNEKISLRSGLLLVTFTHGHPCYQVDVCCFHASSSEWYLWRLLFVNTFIYTKLYFVVSFSDWIYKIKSRRKECLWDRECLYFEVTHPIISAVIPLTDGRRQWSPCRAQARSLCCRVVIGHDSIKENRCLGWNLKVFIVFSNFGENLLPFIQSLFL